MTQKEADCVRISTAPKLNDATREGVFPRYPSTKAANKHIQEALRQSETTKEVTVLGVGTTKMGYVIRFPDAEMANIAKKTTSRMAAKVGEQLQTRQTALSSGRAPVSHGRHQP